MASYNQKSAYDNAWSPSFFGCDDFGDELKQKIKQFQRDKKLSVDGLCGPATAAHLKRKVQGNYIYCGAAAVPIKWNKVIDWADPNGFKASNYKKNYSDRQPRLFINHWDAALSSKSCFQILEGRGKGLSCHFLIDNDGTIFQTGNTSHIHYHAGNSNNYSVGCERSNAYYLRYQDRYEAMGYGKRPVIKGAKVHGRTMRDHTGFYPVQLEALKALWVAISSYYNIPLQTPPDDDGNEITTVYSPVFNSYRGFIHHLQASANKIDCGGLDLTVLIDEIKKNGC